MDLWISEASAGRGGIQRFNSDLIHSLHRLRMSKLRVYSKNNTPHTSCIVDPTIEWHCCGHLPVVLRTAAFALRCLLGGALHPQSNLIVGHVNFSLVGLLLSKVIKKKTFTFAFGIDAWLNPSQSKKALLQRSQIVTISRFTRKKLTETYDLDPARISVLPLTVDEAQFPLARDKPIKLLEQYKIPGDACILLTVGRLDSRECYKGHDRVIAALPLILKENPNTHYMIVGSGDDLIRLKQLAEKFKVSHRVHFSGRIADSQLKDYYALCDIFVMPSQMEGFGIVFLEALISGKPVIAGDQDGSTDALDDGNLGVLVNPENSEAVAEAIIKVSNKSYPNELLYHPEKLRNATLKKFGHRAFDTRVYDIFC